MSIDLSKSDIIKSDDESRLNFIQRIENALTKKFQVSCGTDSAGREYDSITELWRHEGYFDKDNKVPNWYKKSHDFWDNEKNVPSTIDGMLGGFSVLTERDLIASRKFVDDLLASRPDVKERICSTGGRAAECGAGIGRLTKGLLLPLGFKSVDVVETSARLLNSAPSYIGLDDATKCNFICKGLQDFDSDPDTYDLIWVQWVVGYLNDWDLCNFFNRLGKSLKKGGIVIVKDNTCNERAFLADRDDGDITRSFQYLLAIIKESGMRVIQLENGDDMIRWQTDFPDDIWPVPMIALCYDETMH